MGRKIRRKLFKLDKSSGKIVHQGDYYIKQFHRDFPVEKDKYIRLFELSKGSNFIFPKPVEIDDINQTIKLERISPIESVRDAYLSCMKAETMDPWQISKFHQVGIALAQIHRKLSLKTFTKWLPGRSFRQAIQHYASGDLTTFLASAPEAYLHGDFGFSNIFFKNQDNVKPIFFDPSFDGFSVFSSDTLGPVCLDIAHFVSCLDGLVPLWHYPCLHWESLGHLKDIFISGYEQESGGTVDRGWVARFAFAIASAKFAARLSAFGKIGLWLVYNRLKDNLPEKKIINAAKLSR